MLQACGEVGQLVDSATTRVRLEEAKRRAYAWFLVVRVRSWLPIVDSTIVDKQ